MTAHDTADAAWQSAFFQALLAPPEAGAALLPGIASQPAFAVYRNTAMKACIDALAANFPTVQRLVGDDWLRSAAARYVVVEPPRDGRLLCYGETFPAFLATAAAAAQADLPYLADVARLDQAWRQSHASADAAVLDPAALAQLAQSAPEALAHSVLRPHPAARWHWSDGVPAFAIWQRHRPPGLPDTGEIAWHGDGALLTRPQAEVRWQPITQAQHILLDACAAAMPLGAAAEHVLQQHPDTDLAALLPALLQAGCFTALTTTTPLPHEDTP